MVNDVSCDDEYHRIRSSIMQPSFCECEEQEPKEVRATIWPTKHPCDPSSNASLIGRDKYCEKCHKLKPIEGNK